MSVPVSIETKYRDQDGSPRDRDDILRLLRQMLAQGARVVRLGGRMRRPAEDAMPKRQAPR